METITDPLSLNFIFLPISLPIFFGEFGVVETVVSQILF